MKFPVRLLSSAAAATLFCLPTASRAQQAAAAPADGGNGLEEIVVSAERHKTKLQSTPVAVTSFSASTLEGKGATSLLDVQAYTPGLTVSTRSTQGTTQGGFTIRGMGVDAMGSSPAVGIYIDEVYYPSGVANLLGFFDVADVEVLRGPQGTLFGRNTIAGAVLYNSQKPTQDFEGFVTGTAGTYGREEAAGAVNVPITDTLAIRASARLNRVGGFVRDDFTGTDRGEDKTEQGRLQARWKPIDAVTVDLKGEIVDEKANGRAIAVLAVNPNAQFPLVALGFGGSPLTASALTTEPYHFSGFAAPDFLDYSFRTLQATVGWDITSDIKLKSITAYSISKSRQESDLSNSTTPILEADFGNQSLELFTQEVQLAGRSFADEVDWTIGAYYYDSTNNMLGQDSTFGRSPFVVPQNGADISNSNQAEAGYAEATVHILGGVSGVAGIRFSHEEVTASYLNTVDANPFPPFTPITLPTPLFPPSTASFNNVSPHLGLNYQATPDAFLYIKASRGFRAGGFAIGSFIPGGALAFAPEKAWTYEMGARLEFLDHRLRLNPTIFQTDWTQIQFNAFDFTPTAVAVVTRNAGDARIQGAELEGQFAATHKFILTASGGYLQGAYTSVNPGIDVHVGEELQHSPKWKFAVGGRYSFDLPMDTSAVAIVDYSWIDHQKSAVSDSDFIIQPSYGLLDARLQVVPGGGSWTVAVYGTNLTDKAYYVGGVNGFPTFGTVEADLGRRREVGINARFDF